MRRRRREPAAQPARSTTPQERACLTGDGRASVAIASARATKERPAADAGVDLRLSASDFVYVAVSGSVLLATLAGYYVCLRWIVRWLVGAL